MMNEDPKHEITTVVENFIAEIENSELSQHLIAIYRELGIEP
jgi:hypothetical protein